MSTREMELGCLEPARGHAGVDKVAAGRSDNLAREARGLGVARERGQREQHG